MYKIFFPFSFSFSIENEKKRTPPLPPIFGGFQCRQPPKNLGRNAPIPEDTKSFLTKNRNLIILTIFAQSDPLKCNFYNVICENIFTDATFINCYCRVIYKNIILQPTLHMILIIFSSLVILAFFAIDFISQLGFTLFTQTTITDILSNKPRRILIKQQFLNTFVNVKRNKANIMNTFFRNINLDLRLLVLIFSLNCKNE